MKILVCCGLGLSSSLMVEMNIRKILKEMNVKGIGVNHSEISKIENYKADLYVITKDLKDKINCNGRIIILESMLDRKELKDKLSEVLKEKKII